MKKMSPRCVKKCSSPTQGIDQQAGQYSPSSFQTPSLSSSINELLSPRSEKTKMNLEERLRKELLLEDQDDLQRNISMPLDPKFLIPDLHDTESDDDDDLDDDDNSNTSDEGELCKIHSSCHRNRRQNSVLFYLQPRKTQPKDTSLLSRSYRSRNRNTMTFTPALLPRSNQKNVFSMTDTSISSSLLLPRLSPTPDTCTKRTKMNDNSYISK